MNIGSIKERGKGAFKANYWRSVLVAFIMALLTGGATAAAGNQVQNSS